MDANNNNITEKNSEESVSTNNYNYKSENNINFDVNSFSNNCNNYSTGMRKTGGICSVLLEVVEKLHDAETSESTFYSDSNIENLLNIDNTNNDNNTNGNKKKKKTGSTNTNKRKLINSLQTD